jgi:hypothetical protein
VYEFVLYVIFVNTGMRQVETAEAAPITSMPTARSALLLRSGTGTGQKLRLRSV